MNINVNKYYDYRRKVLGTYVDRDHAYGSQCWDLYFDWCEKNGFKGANCTSSGYVKRDGYVWISWIGGSGKRRWMAGGELNSKGINYLPYGVFR